MIFKKKQLVTTVILCFNYEHERKKGNLVTTYCIYNGLLLLDIIVERPSKNGVSFNEAKEHGADIVKQWDSNLDNLTRSSHVKLDRQIREIDEDFDGDGGKAQGPGLFGNPAEDCNCRCALLTRARWALDNKFTKWDYEDGLKEFDPKDYDEYTKKHLKLPDIKSYLEFKNEYNKILRMNLQFFAKQSDKDALYELIKNGTIDKANFDTCYKYFRNKFKIGIQSPIETVYDQKNQFYHITQRHIDMISKENINRIVKTISNPTSIYESVDIFRIKANCYLLEENGKPTLIAIVRNGIITSYEPNDSYLRKIKKSKKIW